VVQLPFSFTVGTNETTKKIGNGVKGKYVSVERFRQLEGGKLEWIMATSSTPGGSIPDWLTERSIPGEIIKVFVITPYPYSSMEFHLSHSRMFPH
jgi:hypothetical protein